MSNPAHEKSVSAYCLRVGYGSVARIHEDKLTNLGVKTVGYIESSPVRRRLLTEAGHIVFEDVRQVMGHRADRIDVRKPFFWDICVDTKSHLDVTRDILTLDPAAMLLIEAPLCEYEQLDAFEQLITAFPRCKVVINEQFCCTQVTDQLVALTANLTPTRIFSEMSKWRVPDFLAGRNIDHKNGAFGYEFTHMVTTVLALGPLLQPRRIIESTLEDAVVPVPGGGSVTLPRQASALVRYVAMNGIMVTLHSSMMGEFAYFHPLCLRQPRTQDPATKYRVLGIDCAEGVTAIGFYEPLTPTLRNVCVVALFDTASKRMLRQNAPFDCDLMRDFLSQAVRYFTDDGANPCTMSTAGQVLSMIHSFTEAAITN